MNGKQVSHVCHGKHFECRKNNCEKKKPIFGLMMLLFIFVTIVIRIVRGIVHFRLYLVYPKRLSIPIKKAKF